ncbi:hypothetical protein ACFL1G_06890 [Planctomycetota bacterium]
MAEIVNEELTIAEPEKKEKSSYLSRWLIVLGWLAMLIFTFHACTHMVAAGDTWVAMACGRHFINHGVDTVEPFSANSHKAGPTPKEVKQWPGWAQSLTDKVGLDTVKRWHPTGWLNQNWLTHVIFYWLTHKSPFADAAERSFNTLIYWKFAIYVFGLICIYYTARILGAHPALAAVFACFAMFAGRSFIDVRPAGFSNVLTAAFLFILVLATYRNILYIWLLVPLTVFWSNVHGGYIYAFIMLAPFVAIHLLTLFSKKWFVSLGRKGIYHTIAAGFTTLIAVIIFNPFHLTNFTHTFIISVSEHAKMWRTVNEWHPAFEWSNPVGTGFPFLVMLILSIAFFVFWLFSKLLQPKLLKAPKDELDTQEKRFFILFRFFGWAATMIICWATFISFSFVKADLVGFLLCASFSGIILLSIYKNVHYVHIIGLLVLLALWLTDAGNGAGRYIFPFVLLPAYVTIYIITSLFSKNIKFKQNDIIFPAATAIVTIILMTAFFNPLKMKFPEWDGQVFNWVWGIFESCFELRRRWHPVYENNLNIQYRNLFGILYLINLLSVSVWIAIPYLKKALGPLREQTEAQQQSQNHTYRSPKFDLVLTAIAALTIYMAIRSRRFIPIAAIAACPIMAAFLTQMIHTISASINFHKHNRCSVSAIPHKLQLFFTMVAAGAVIFFGTWWTVKFKRVYLDCWPTDAEFTSVFMRMTASDRKPFHAGDFIRENNLKGKMFNYWTEGGFIAWAQNPDPNTGKTSLQLFMDGRAQAAYKPATYRLWNQIMAGGPVGFEAAIRKKKLTNSDYIEMSRYISQELRKHNVWLTLMPLNDNSRNLVRAIETNPEWTVIFLNNKQKMFVDIKSPRGKKLFEGIKTGETKYPDDFSKYLYLAHIYKYQNGIDAKKTAFNYALRAFNLKPSQVPLSEILSLAGVTQLKDKVEAFCIDFVDDTNKNKDEHQQSDGYFNRITAAIMACDYLRKIANNKEDQKLVESYSSMIMKYRAESRDTMKGKRW